MSCKEEAIENRQLAVAFRDIKSVFGFDLKKILLMAHQEYA